MVRFSATLNDKVKEVVLENAPKNSTYTSPAIQKEILNIVSNEIRDKIREEIGDRKYCILVDESKDASDKEQMVLVLRYVDSDGYVQEFFFDIQCVKNTCVVTLKKGITDILNRYNLPIENMRGQGYDGANNMRGRVNGLKALFLKDCKYAYYVHCFAHRLQLALVHTAEKNGRLWDFFSMLNNIVNLVTASSLRLGSFQDAQEDDINQRLANGDLETGRGANQIGTFPRATDTRWSSHYGSVCSLIDKFDAAYTTIEDISTSDPNETCGVGQAQSTLEKMQEFKFVFVLHLVYKIMGYTEILCQGLQKKTQDIVNVVALVSNTKLLLHKLRSDEDGYRLFIETLCLFCIEHGIDIPDMTAPYMQGTGRSCQQRDNITVDHHYHHDIFNAAIDLQIAELVGRFPEDTMELLVLCSCLDPRESFKAFHAENLCTLAEKFYPLDFSRQEQVRNGIFQQCQMLNQLSATKWMQIFLEIA
ncbi:zinc finger MYM-type protein 1-like [Papaver somniferum]|uniref:zinc finger MYM-type protein 1-like n=1 Tax=Papaver somniferum TaxID=3469 RepID=UPI000E6F559A|nr:zinc finger MYM-type protein 1-like [Papaver somniferum]